MGEQDAYKKAKNRVEAKLGFYVHLAIYIAVNALLVSINMRTSPEYSWFIWPLLGWGAGLFFHGMGVFVFSGESAYKKKMIEKEMKKDASRRQ